jgi:hypothetical protein
LLEHDLFDIGYRVKDNLVFLPNNGFPNP